METAILTRPNAATRPGMNTPALADLERATEEFTAILKSLEDRAASATDQGERLVAEYRAALAGLFTYCRAVDHEYRHDHEALKSIRKEFREKTNDLLAKSYLYNRARTWPQGHPGDYNIIEHVYHNMALSSGLGGILDRYFLSTTLARAVRSRKDAMRNLIASALSARERARILNIGCGSCRELVELAPELNDTNAQITCLDFDPDALAFSGKRLGDLLTSAKAQFRKYNAVRMVNAQRNLKEFGRQDLIYTIGLLDYLTDDVLRRLLGALYELLAPGGVLFAAFKDSDRYDTADYHWTVDWDAFYQRTADESRKLISAAGIPDEAVSVSRDATGVIIFYSVTRR